MASAEIVGLAAAGRGAGRGLRPIERRAAEPVLPLGSFAPVVGVVNLGMVLLGAILFVP